MPRYTVENTVLMGKHVTVFNGGEEIKNVIEADTDLGFAVIHDPSVAGYQRLVTGKISITMTDRNSDA